MFRVWVPLFPVGFLPGSLISRGSESIFRGSHFLKADVGSILGYWFPNSKFMFSPNSSDDSSPFIIITIMRPGSEDSALSISVCLMLLYAAPSCDSHKSSLPLLGGLPLNHSLPMVSRWWWHQVAHLPSCILLMCPAHGHLSSDFIYH